MNRALNDDTLAPPSPLHPPARQARHILAMRRARQDHLPAILFGEPGWELLLQLYVAEAERHRLSSAQCVALSSSPPSTAARWIKLLVQEGLVIDDSVGETLSLTPHARELLRGFLRQFTDTSPSPVWRRSAARIR